MPRQMSSADPAEETYSGEEGVVAISGSVLGLGIKNSMGRKEKLSERNPSLHSPLCFPFRLYQEERSLCLTLGQTYSPGRAAKEAEMGVVFHLV